MQRVSNHVVLKIATCACGYLIVAAEVLAELRFNKTIVNCILLIIELKKGCHGSIC